MSIVLNWLESLSTEINVTKKCSREILRQSSCSICTDQCKHKALNITYNRVTIDTQLCIRCGECVAACPLGALEGMGPQRVFDKEGLVYVESSPPSVKELLIYKKRGIKSVIVNENSLNPSWVQAIEDTNLLLKRMEEQSITINNLVAEEKISRREFFSSIQFQGKQLAKALTPASWKLSPASWDLRNYYPDIEFFFVKINRNRCLLCQACFSICPEMVFSLQQTSFEIHSEKCVNCQLCIDLCPEHAIEITTSVKRKEHKSFNCTSHVCQNCGQTFYSFQGDVERCPICNKRHSDWLSPF